MGAKVGAGESPRPGAETVLVQGALDLMRHDTDDTRAFFAHVSACLHFVISIRWKEISRTSGCKLLRGVKKWKGPASASFSGA